MGKRDKWKLSEIDLGLVEPAELNANVMSSGDFEQLKKNIKKSGLSSAVTLYKRKSDGKFVTVGGHHRIKACIELGYGTIPAIWTDEENLSRDEILAIQLSHNSLHGEDDKGILKRLFDEIQSVDFKEFANINVDELETISLTDTAIIPLSEHYTVSLTLYNADMENLTSLMDILQEEVGRNDLVIIADQKDTEEEYMKLSGELRKVYNLKASSLTFAKILELARKQLGLEQQESEDN